MKCNLARAGSRRLRISYEMRAVFNVIGKKAYSCPLMLLTVSHTVQENVTIFFSNENIKSMDDCKRHKIDRFLITKLILAAHLKPEWTAAER
jgi:hypothetical protein